MEKHYEAIAKIIGGTLYSSNRLKGLVKTFIEYFSSQDSNFDSEQFSKNALNGTYDLLDTEEYIEMPPVEPKINTWEPKVTTVVDSRIDKIHEDWKLAMKNMSNIVGKSYGSPKTKRGKNVKAK